MIKRKQAAATFGTLENLQNKRVETAASQDVTPTCSQDSDEEITEEVETLRDIATIQFPRLDEMDSISDVLGDPP